MLGSGVYVQGVLSYGYYNNDIHRDLVGENIGPTENARGSFGSNLFGGRFEAGWKNTFGQVNLTPFASIQFDALSQNAYSEFDRRERDHHAGHHGAALQLAQRDLGAVVAWPAGRRELPGG